MKKMRKILAAAGISCMIAASLSGCEKVTAAGLMEEAAANMKEASSYQADMDIHMDIQVADSGVSLGIAWIWHLPWKQRGIRTFIIWTGRSGWI